MHGPRRHRTTIAVSASPAAVDTALHPLAPIGRQRAGATSLVLKDTPIAGCRRRTGREDPEARPQA
jgi:hypothetical protein